MPLLYRDLTRPHLWPVADLEEARKECRQTLNGVRISEAGRQGLTAQLQELDAEIARKKPPKRR